MGSLVDLRIDVDDYAQKFAALGHRRSSSLPLFMDRRGSFSYNKLPEEPLKLSVLKLDGSRFEIEVMRSATVAELRQAVEDVFGHLPTKGPGKISWPHVWGHFCLCYNGRKLVFENDYIWNYGIRDGDQLQFVRHLSSCHKSKKKRSPKWDALSENRISFSRWNSKDEGWNDKDYVYDNIENGTYPHYHEKQNDGFDYNEVRWRDFFKRWFTYSSLPSVERVRSLNSSPVRSSCGIFGNFRRIIKFCGNNHCFKRDAWAEYY